MDIDSTCLAVALKWDLHGAAEENFVSSVLAAALTENEGFRRWLALDIAELPKFVVPTPGVCERFNPKIPRKKDF